jgi:hypothetical protein
MILYKTIAYSISFIVITLVGIYGLNLPGLISRQPDLVRQYYYENWKFYIPFDWVLVAIYLSLGLFAANKFGAAGHLQTVAAILLTTLVISGSFWAYFINQPLSTSFFSQWFHKAGFRAVIYDMLLLALTYFGYAIVLAYFPTGSKI